MMARVCPGTLPRVYVSSPCVCMCARASLVHATLSVFCPPAQAGSALSTHLALQGQTAAKNHSPGFWHSQGIPGASLGPCPLPCALGSTVKSDMGTQ